MLGDNGQITAGLCANLSEKMSLFLNSPNTINALPVNSGAGEASQNGVAAWIWHSMGWYQNSSAVEHRLNFKRYM
jgi:hypothetical protein